ncbi:MAG: hypothetical protein A2571_02390 [Candidatus Vogelbacteria bacterium RIFOXYD1_FULL_44_32]|uniref:Excinuclease ABC subunit C n=1 Tax=Candidatus Vogelbacteria bacterium RIFOXYD1_FULL_44_32 TaxID=1802438 RepID=A0A1G2QDE8_9BACT|nr:MAG: hypothetical protein A2571_02390 [Candidatus Vogelbacteria bacterium RIFOXYD1_FULL_44_32]
MILADLKQFNLPDEPGVYFFKRGKKTTYIGKATSLRDRVRSYFSCDLATTRGVAILNMVAESDGLEFKTTNSVLEALILEAALIRNLKPKYNTLQKDDKSYWYVVVTKEKWPRVLMVREKDLATAIEPENIKQYFGPFPNASELKEALKIIRKIIPWRDKCEPEIGKPCFNAQLGLCPGVCAGTISHRDYLKNIRHFTLFFSGKTEVLIKALEKEMAGEAKKKNFEQAGKIRNQIFALTHINDMAMIKENRQTRGVRIEAYDIAHLAGKETIGVMTVILGGTPEKGAYRKFIIKGAGSKVVNDTLNLKELLERRLAHSEWPLPVLFVIDGGKAQLNVAKKVLAEAGYQIPVVAVTKDEHHRPKEIIGDNISARDFETDILLANAEAHRFAIAFHRRRLGRLYRS